MNKLFDYLIGTFVFLSSVFYVPGVNFHDSQRILFRIGGMLFFALFLSREPLRKIRNVWISAYLAYAIVVFLVIKAVQGIAINSLIDIFLMVSLYYVFSNYINDDNVIFKAIQAIIVINLIFVLFQFLRIDPLMLDDQRRPNTHLVGLFGHPMNMGIFFSVVLPYVFFKSKLWAIPAFGLLLVSNSYISIALGIMGVLIYLFFINKITLMPILKVFLILTIVSGVVIALLSSFQLNTSFRTTVIHKFTTRWEINYPLLKVALSNPYFGYGLGTFPHVSAKVMSPEVIDKIGFVDVTWNDYLGCMIEMGVATLFIFYGIFHQTIVKFIRSVKSKEISALFASLATIPIGIMFHSYMNYINVGIVCLALFALFEIKIKETKNVYEK